MLHQALVFGSMLTAGFALFATAAWIEADRAAFTSSGSNEITPLVTHVSALKSEEVKPPVEEEAPMMMLPPVEIVGRRGLAKRRGVPVAVNEPAIATLPCSDWQEVGPQRVDEGTGIGTRRVRSLCLGPAVTER
ncbi:MAG TPA: hypothetical protein VFQ35_00920 [Polyangiaceae bacterium]|nr:hypothetical protein [Polyangiaceae bacterium]